MMILAALLQAVAPGPCSPIDVSARILTKPAPNAIHPDWSDESRIGLSWTFRPTTTVNGESGMTFLKGDLISPRGGVVNTGVYVLAREWQCDETG